MGCRRRGCYVRFRRSWDRRPCPTRGSAWPVRSRTLSGTCALPRRVGLVAYIPCAACAACSKLALIPTLYLCLCATEVLAGARRTDCGAPTGALVEQLVAWRLGAKRGARLAALVLWWWRAWPQLLALVAVRHEIRAGVQLSLIHI